MVSCRGETRGTVDRDPRMDRKRNLKAETETFIFAAQERATGIDSMKFNRDKSVTSPHCWLLDEKGEGINHIISRKRECMTTLSVWFTGSSTISMK